MWRALQGQGASMHPLHWVGGGKSAAVEPVAWGEGGAESKHPAAAECGRLPVDWAAGTKHPEEGGHRLPVDHSVAGAMCLVAAWVA